MEKKMTLFDLGNEERQIEDALYENGGELTPELEDALSDNEESLRRKADGYFRIIRELQYHAQNCKDEAARMTEKARRAEKAAATLKEHILYSMGLFGWDKFEGDEVKFSVRNTKALDVDEEKMLGDLNVGELIAGMNLPGFVKVSAKIDKTALKAEFAPDNLPDGCQWVENQSLNMR